MSQDPLHLLCVEPGFPGRLGAVADWLVRRRGYRAWFFCNRVGPPEVWPATVGQGLDVVQFGVGGVAREGTVPWTRGLERGLCYAYGAWEVIDARRPRPIDLALGRSDGLGSTLFVPVTYPGVPILNFFDYYVSPRAHDLVDDDAARLPVEYLQWRRSANAMDLLDLENGITPWIPTRWQRDLYPREYRDDFVVVHDGIDADRLAGRRDPTGRRARTVAGRSIPAGTRVVTFVSRRLDRLRGFDRFLALANRLQAERPDVLCIAVGGGPVDRMLDIPYHGQDYGAHALAASPPPDPSRFWTLGAVSSDVVAEVLAASDLHVCASRPYPVARSTLEALAAGCVVLAWDSEPIREVIVPEQNGLIVPPGDLGVTARAALAVLNDPAEFQPLGKSAVETIREHYDRDVTLPRLAEVFDRLAGNTLAPPA